MTDKDKQPAKKAATKKTAEAPTDEETAPEGPTAGRLTEVSQSPTADELNPAYAAGAASNNEAAADGSDSEDGGS